MSPYHPTVRATLRSLEHVCRLASDDEASAQYKDEMLETLKIVSETMPIVIARTLECSAAAHEEAGRARARRLYQRLLEGAGGSMPRGTVDPYWLLGKLGIARASAVVGQTQEAERLRTEVENQLWEAFKDDARSDVEFFLPRPFLRPEKTRRLASKPSASSWTRSRFGTRLSSVGCIMRADFGLHDQRIFQPRTDASNEPTAWRSLPEALRTRIRNQWRGITSRQDFKPHGPADFRPPSDAFSEPSGSGPT